MKSFSNTVEEKSLRQIWASLLHFWVVEEEECVCCNAGSQPWVVGWRRRFWSPLVSRREQSAGVEDFFFFFMLSSRGVTACFHMYSTFEQIPNERFWKCFWFRVLHFFTICVPSLISGHFYWIADWFPRFIASLGRYCDFLDIFISLLSAVIWQAVLHKADFCLMHSSA